MDGDIAYSNYSHLIGGLTTSNWSLTNQTGAKFLRDYDSIESTVKGEFVTPVQVMISSIFGMGFITRYLSIDSKKKWRSIKDRLSTIRRNGAWKKINYARISFTICCFALFIAVIPLLLVLWLSVLCYRQYVYFVIKVLR